MKNVKKRRSNTNSTKRSSSRKIKGRITTPSELPKGAKIGVLIAALVLLVLCFINMGLIFTIITAVCLAIIYGIAKLLDKVSHNKKKRKIVNIILIIILIIGIISIILFGVFMIYITINAPKFDTSKLNKNEVTIIYDKDGNQIAKLGSEMREKVKYDELPQVLVDAIIATEDSRFYQHNGFDAPRFLKATLGQLTGHSDAGGASTLSMQVIKNSFTSTESSGVKGIIRKFTDIYLAIFKLEKNYSKEEIIEFYVNNHFLGGNIYGVQEASREYFGKDVGDLNLSEASILAGMFKSPNFYRPNVNPKNATARRDTVLYLMKKHGYITKAEYDMARSIPVDSLTTEQSIATTSEYQAYIDTVVEEVEEKYNVNAYTAPLLIYTNMDKSKQDAVNDVMNGKTYNWINDKVQGAAAVLDSGTGKILAIGGGRNKSGANTFNYATQLNRQPGSTAKPLFDYGPGIEYNNWSTYGYQNGDDNYKLFDDSPYSYSNGQSIKNWDGGYFGSITMRRALSASRNIPALKAFQMVDNSKIQEFVTSLGIEPEVSNGKIHEAHSIGAFTGVSPLKMSAAYAAFSNGGYYNEPYSVSKIVFRDTGKTEEHKTKPKQVMSDATAYMISSILKDVSITGGKPANVAAKTGTTNYDDNTMSKYHLPSDAIRDSWVVGYTNKTVIGMWYGYDFIDSEYCLRNLPATIQKDKLFLALANGVFDKKAEDFKMPDSVVKASIGGSYEYFKKGHEPKNGSEEAPTKLDTPSGLKVVNSGNRVTLTWNGVNRLPDDDKYGKLIYNIYQGSTLIDFTESTSYSFTSTSSPYATYKVVATYKSYSGAQSDAATYTLNEPKKEEPQESPPTFDCGVKTKVLGDSIPKDTCSFKVNGQLISTRTIEISENSCSTDGVTFDTAGGCQIKYKVTYNGKIYTFPVDYIVN